VEDDGAPIGGGPNRSLIAQIGFYEPNAWNIRQVLEPAVGQVVKGHDIVSVGGEAPAEV
jgi:hypothetical protein